jgi:hypothetical protein
MSKKLTSIDWLISQFEESHSYINEIFKEAIEKAKAMNKEEIKNAFEMGHFTQLSEEDEKIANDYMIEIGRNPKKGRIISATNTSEQYYNDTFEK